MLSESIWARSFSSKGSSEVNDKVVFCLPYLGLLKWVWRGKKVPLDNFCLHLSLWASFFLCESSAVATQRTAEPLPLVRVIPLCSHVHAHTGWFLWRTHSPFSTVNTPVMPAPPNSRCQCPMQAEATVSWVDAFHHSASSTWKTYGCFQWPISHAILFRLLFHPPYFKSPYHFLHFF